MFTASKQFRRRVPYAGHFLTPRRLWLNKIPTQCDVVIEFPGSTYNFFCRKCICYIFPIRRRSTRQCIKMVIITDKISTSKRTGSTSQRQSARKFQADSFLYKRTIQCVTHNIIFFNYWHNFV